MRDLFRAAYVRGVDLSPDPLKKILFRARSAVTGEPLAAGSDIAPDRRFPGGYRGGLVLSADFELGWAFRYSKSNPHPEQKAAQARSNFPHLIGYLDRHAIPMTWATVGHLFLRGCRRGDHDWMRRIPHFENPNWRFDNGDWFDCDPCVSWEEAKAWYAPDLIESILAAKTDHEIGCHSFSHIDLTDENCPEEVARDELRACVEAAREWGLTLRSFVFPGGTYGNKAALKEAGFAVYRQKERHQIGYPYIDAHGLVATPSTMALHSHPGLSADYQRWLYRHYIDEAVRRGLLCHLWLHPSLDEYCLHEIFPQVLEHAAAARDRGDLWIGTMADVAEQVTSRG